MDLYIPSIFSLPKDLFFWGMTLLHAGKNSAIYPSRSIHKNFFIKQHSALYCHNLFELFSKFIPLV